MSKRRGSGWAAAFMAGTLLLSIACEDSGVIAPSDGTITVSLNPTAVTVDPNVPANAEKAADVRALVLDKDGLPIENANVFFSSTGGRLVKPGSNPEEALDSATTDSQGLARATIIVTGADADEIDVTALSGALTATATLTKEVVGEQRPPTASLTIEPCGTPCVGEINRVVTFRSTATDPNAGDVLTSRWTIVSSVTAQPEQVVTQGTRINRTYNAAQDLSVQLEVSDDPNALTAPGTPGIWDDAAAKDYKICNNRAPVADAVATVSGARTVTVDGSGSTDPDGDALLYAWTCGNGTTATGEEAVCSYLTAGSFTILLTVTDVPSGCPARNDTDTAVVTLTP